MLDAEDTTIYDVEMFDSEDVDLQSGLFVCYGQAGSDVCINHAPLTRLSHTSYTSLTRQYLRMPAEQLLCCECK
jgi:hypothetical protein